MKLNYKPLGDYVRQATIRNTGLQVKKLIGVSMNKRFIESVANINGVDFENYKVIKKNQFACKLMSVGRDKKLPVDLLKDYDEAIVSSAYYVFEVIDKNVLLPEYLMMWFRRSESDRYVGFISGGDVRGGISWDDLCTMPIIVPDIEIQKEIVKEYNTIIKRIELNNQLIQKLEETAQTIYKQWFVDFEFPDENGNSYKSSGGEMEYNEELDQEIPKGWELERISKISKLNAGGDMPKIYSNEKTSKCQVPIYANGIINDGFCGFTNEAKVSTKALTISARGNIGFCMIREQPFVPIVRLLVLIPKQDYYLNYIFKYLQNFNFDDEGSVQSQLTKPQFSILKILIPNAKYILENFHQLTFQIFKEINVRRNEKILLEDFRQILLSKMSKIPVEVVAK